MKAITSGKEKPSASQLVIGRDLHYEVQSISARTSKAVVVHVILIVCTLSTLAHYGSVSVQAWIFSALILMINFARIPLDARLVNQGRMSAKRWRLMFGWQLALSGLLWGLLTSTSMASAGPHSESSFILLMVTGGLVAGSMAALTPWTKIALVFMVGVLGLPILTLIESDLRANLVIAISIATFMVYMWMQSKALETTFISLRDREMRFEAMSRYGMEGALIHQDGKIVEVNDAFLQIMNVDRETAMTRTIFDYLRPDFHAPAREHLKEPNNSWEVVCVRDDGTEVFVETWANVIDLGGAPARVTYLRDIGTRKKVENALIESERNLQEFMTTAFDALSDILLVTLVDGTIESVNRKWREFSGLTLAETKPEVVAGLVAEEDRDTFSKFLRPNQNGGREVSVRLFRTSDQTYRHHLGRSSPVRDRNGVITKWLFSWTDVHDQYLGIQRNHELEVTAKSAREASQIKSAFLANMSHEIRTPLNGIIGLSDLLLDLPATNLQNKYQRTLKESAESLLLIVNDILDLSKIESGQMVAEEVEFELVPVIEFQVELLASRARDKSLGLGSFVDPNIPAGLRGDSTRLAQVVLNLVSNAIKFTKHGGVAVRANLLFSDGEEAWVRLEIEDSGIGMSKDEQTKLFQPFSQVDASHSRKYGGTGLGLSICLGIVQLLKGRIFVHSEAGSGSIFTVDLPFKVDKRRSAAQFPMREPTPTKVKRALILDNDPLSFGIKNAYLSSWGWTATHASLRQVMEGGLAILDGVRLVVIDSSLSPSVFSKAMNWFQQASLGPDCTVLLVADEAAREGLIKANSPFCKSFLAKPIKQQEFYNLVEEKRQSDIFARQRSEASLSNAGALPVGYSAEASEVAAPLRELRVDGSARRILVVEDNTTNQMLIKALLKKIGCSPHVVANGVEALEALRHETFDLILMDCQMPEMDGFEATTRIRAIEIEEKKVDKIKIIALTANVRVEDRQRCLAVGMNDFLSKPVRRDDLVEKLEHWLAA